LAVTVPAMVITGYFGGAWMGWHYRIGYAVLTLLLFRLVWGFVGGYWSRFTHFVRRPWAVVAYLRLGNAGASVGHNPLGAYSVLSMLLALLAQAASGLMSDDEVLSAGPLVHKVPEGLVRVMSYLHTGPVKLVVILLVCMHLLAIAWYRLRRQENLISPMILGDKKLERCAVASRDDCQARGLAVFLVLACAALVAALLAWAR
jgi:cytochrome b